MRIIWQTERRITNEVLGVRGLTVQTHSGIELIYGKKKKSKMLPMVTSSMCLSLNRAYWPTNLNADYNSTFHVKHYLYSGLLSLRAQSQR